MEMKFTTIATLGVLAFGAASTNANAITIDGTLDAAYGAAVATVANPSFNPYSIYLTDQNGFLYGFLQATGTSGLPFANLYFDQNQPNGAGSTVGFEITNSRAFTPMITPDGKYTTLVNGFQFAVSENSTGTTIEFAIPNVYFTAPIAGLDQNPFITYPVAGDLIRLTGSQSFGYNFVFPSGGLASVTINAAVPEPATWAMMILGFFGVGFMAYRRRSQRASMSAV